MSEYQYYEFLAIDKPLSTTAISELRQLSSRANITQNHMKVTYNYGDFKGDPIKLMRKYFDLFVYTANWGTHRFAIRMPKRLINKNILDRFVLDEEIVNFHDAGENIIIDMIYDNDGESFEHFEEGESWMPQLSPLRNNMLDGDISVFILLWLIQVSRGWTRDETPMLVPGIQLSTSLSALADFLCLDRNLLEAAENPETVDNNCDESIDTFLRTLPEEEKIKWLKQLYEGYDPHLSALLRFHHKAALKNHTIENTPTAGDLRTKAKIITEKKRKTG